MGIAGGREDTYAQHASHAEALDLAEAAQGFFGELFDEEAECALEQGGCDLRNLRMYSNEEEQRFVHIRSDF